MIITGIGINKRKRMLHVYRHIQAMMDMQRRYDFWHLDIGIDAEQYNTCMSALEGFALPDVAPHRLFRLPSNYIHLLPDGYIGWSINNTIGTDKMNYMFTDLWKENK